MELPFNPAIPLLGIYPKNSGTPVQKNFCTPIFTAALFTIAKIWTEPNCPSAGEWMKKAAVHLHTGILHRGRKEGILAFCDSMEEGPRECYAK